MKAVFDAPGATPLANQKRRIGPPAIWISLGEVTTPSPDLIASSDRVSGAGVVPVDPSDIRETANVGSRRGAGGLIVGVYSGDRGKQTAVAGVHRAGKPFA